MNCSLSEAVLHSLNLKSQPFAISSLGKYVPLYVI